MTLDFLKALFPTSFKRALASGQVDLIATGNVVAAKLIQDNPDQKIESKFIMKDSPCYVGIRKGDTELLQQVNDVIANLKQSGKLNQLSMEWFGEPLPKDLTTTATAYRSMSTD